MIKDLRKLDPAWQAEQIGFGYWRYSHFDKGLATQSYSQIVDAELDLYNSNWYLFQDTKIIRCGTKQSILHFLEKKL